tara:strand:+ start:1441 stop:1926 length:486 start_codon:yes stop_codon:yes gene_type:complete
MTKKKENNSMIENRKAKFNFVIEDSVEAGIVLNGSEIKSIRKGKISLDNSYASEKNGSIWLFNAHIQDYSGNQKIIQNYNPKRPRKLLLKKKEISKIKNKLLSLGYTLVPLDIHYNSKGFAKIQIGISKGRKKEDKRQYKKEQDWKREKSQIFKKQNFQKL